MKRHIGKLIALFGILMLYPLSGILAPWITRMLFSYRMPDGKIVILNINAGLNGFLVCLAIGGLLLFTGVLIEVLQALKNRQNRNPNTASHGTGCALP
jgi:hypothetical protein